MLSRHNEGTFLNKIKSETKIFANINYILDKIESDGYFSTIQTTFQQIFDKEMAFAVQGKKLSRVKEDKIEEHEVRHQKPTDQQHLYFQGELKVDCSQDR